MPSFTFSVNGRSRTVDAESGTPLLWVLRDRLGLTGTRYGCGIAQCGACTVHVDGEPQRSCALPVESMEGREIRTIEGLGAEALHPLQEAWIELEVPQCGYCQSGQLMSAAALLESTPQPSDEEIDRAMSGNLCRCGTYDRIRRAIHRVAGTPMTQQEEEEDR
jgi:aerobic-type carbon monoxide dehydrogenase small subunit (CoxS/CutS family)